jgi:diguanylate cyclase
MPRMITPTSRKTLEQLEQALRDHDEWHEDFLRVIVCGLPGDPNDLEINAHRRCRFGRWYYEGATTEIRELPAFAAIGVEHARLHATAARLLREASGGGSIVRADYESFVAGSARLRLKLESLCQEVSGALRNRDALTGAYSRADMLPVLRDWRELAKRRIQHCCIVFMDLDHFKELNDAYGHALGDDVLAATIRYVTGHLRSYDKVFRYGGDEFLIALPGVDLSSCRAVIKHIREGVTATPLVAGPAGRPIHVTASFGLAMLDPTVSVEESIERADQALLLAKTAGRNRAISWDPSVETGTRLKRLRMEDFAK